MLATKYILGGMGALALVGTVGGYFHGIGVGENNIYKEWNEQEDAKEEALDLATARIAVLQARLDEKVTVQYVDRVKTVTETEYVNRDVIKTVFEESPYLPEGLVYAHDQLVEGAPIDPEKAANLAASPYTWERMLDVVAKNYSAANQGIIRNESWNDFYSGVYRSYDDYRLPEGNGGSTNNLTAPTGPDSSD